MDYVNFFAIDNSLRENIYSLLDYIDIEIKAVPIAHNLTIHMAVDTTKRT